MPNYNFGDLISFSRENIYQVWDKSMQADEMQMKKDRLSSFKN
jgi:hypothetical protein